MFPTASGPSIFICLSWICSTAFSHIIPDNLKTLEVMRDRGVEWLLSQRNEEFGWPSGDTARVVIALASAVDEWPAKNDLVSRLIVKQLEIELLEKLLRKDIDPITPESLAFYALALGAACKDPHNFYGHNLVASVEKHHGDQDYPGYSKTFGYSFTSLVTCLAGSRLHKHQARHLMQIVKDEDQSILRKPYSIDTRGTAIMALECIRHRKKSETLFKNMHEHLKAITEEQRDDGSFGNIHTTAIAIQALGASGDFKLHWNRTAAAVALTSLQEHNGSFLNNIYATSEAVMAASTLLNGKGLLGLRRGHCNEARLHNSARQSSTSNFKGMVSLSSTSVDVVELPANEETYRPVNDTNGEPTTITAKLSQGTNPSPQSVVDSISEVSNMNGTSEAKSISFTTNSSAVSDFSMETRKFSRPNTVSIRYWLWIGQNPQSNQQYNLTVSVPANSTFFFTMQRAAEIASEYEFSATVWPNGHKIDAICGNREESIERHYWLLYLLSSDPDPSQPPSTMAPGGVDDLRVQDGQVYLFWFKEI